MGRKLSVIGTKAAFVRSFPPEHPTRLVCAAADRFGMLLLPREVRTIRYLHRQRQKGPSQLTRKAMLAMR